MSTQKRDGQDVRYVAYTLRGDEKHQHYVPVGRGFHNRDGTFTVYLDALPLDGVLLLRIDDKAPRPSAPGTPP